jgi:hypothetical protein
VRDDTEARRIARRRRALHKELNQPVVVAPFPIADLAERSDAAVIAWFTKLFELYDVDPVSSTRWEILAMRLALERFPNFELVGVSPKVGNPGTKDDVAKLYRVFRNYEASRGSGSKFKNFLRDHRAACAACKITTPASLKEAMRRARRQYEADRRGEELLIRHEMMKALGIRPAVELVYKKS